MNHEYRPTQYSFLIHRNMRIPLQIQIIIPFSISTSCSTSTCAELASDGGAETVRPWLLMAGNKKNQEIIGH